MKKALRSNNALLFTRTRLGLTQEQMGRHLGVSKSMVKLVETNRRFLTSDKWLKLLALENQLSAIRHFDEQQSPPAIAEADSRSGMDELEIRYRVSRCHYQAVYLQKKLKRMELGYSFVKTSLHNLDAMEKLHPGTGNPAGIDLVQVRNRLLKKLVNCNTRAQADTKKKIVLLQAEAAYNKIIHPLYVHTNEKPILSPLKQPNMDYTVSMISSRTDCQAMIDMANDDKDALDYRKTGLLRQKQNASATTVGLEADLAATTAEIEALQTVLDSLPEGSVKEDTRVKLRKADYKKFLLEQRKTNYGSVALIEKEYNIACIEQSIAETDAFILAITTRMNELPEG